MDQNISYKSADKPDCKWLRVHACDWKWLRARLTVTASEYKQLEVTTSGYEWLQVTTSQITSDYKLDWN